MNSLALHYCVPCVLIASEGWCKCAREVRAGRWLVLRVSLLAPRVFESSLKLANKRLDSTCSRAHSCHSTASSALGTRPPRENNGAHGELTIAFVSHVNLIYIFPQASFTFLCFALRESGYQVVISRYFYGYRLICKSIFLCPNLPNVTYLTIHLLPVCVCVSWLVTSGY